MAQYQITALFQDGKSRLYVLNNDAKVFDLINKIETDSEIKKPKDRTLNILYLGRFLDPSTRINDVENSQQFTVNCFFRAPKNHYGSDDAPLASELRGFDRLARMGYSPSQIRDFRENFHRFHSSLNYPENTRIEMEEEWFPALFSGDEAPQFFLPANHNHNQDQNQNESEPDNINQNSDFDISPDSEVPFAQEPTDNSDSSQSWTSFFLGVAFGFIFRLNWYIFIPMMLPDRSVLIGYLFGCGLFYMFAELSK